MFIKGVPSSFGSPYLIINRLGMQYISDGYPSDKCPIIMGLPCVLA